MREQYDHLKDIHRAETELHRAHYEEKEVNYWLDAHISHCEPVY